MPSLFVFRGQDQGVRFELDEDALGLGRDPSNPIQIHDNEVSRRHAEIRRNNSIFTLADLGSSNGTFINGRKLSPRERHTLASGDELQLGSTMMLFTGSEDEEDLNLSDKINIIHGKDSGDHSRIIRSMKQEEGSQILMGDAGNSASPWLARARSNLQVMYRTALAVSHTLDIDQLLNRIMQLIFEWVEADRGCMMLLNPETGALEPKVRRTRKGLSEDKISISKTILDYVLEHNEGVLTSDARDDQRWNPAASILQMGICEAICAPMQGRYGVVGVIYIDTSISPQRIVQQGSATKFTEEHLKLMIAIAHQAALAVEDTRYYSAMVQSERLAAMGQTIATLSHHIKNILQGIRGGSFLIKEGLSRHDEGMVGKGWEFVEKNQERISSLVMDMLTFSKEREPELVPADLNSVAADVVELMNVRAIERGVELAFVPEGHLPLLTFDPEAMHRAVLNVVSNAIDACDRETMNREMEPEEEEDDFLGDGNETREIAPAIVKACQPPIEPRVGRVEVRVEYAPADGMVRVVVQDNGCGIAAGEIDHVFSLFVSHKGGRGTGLGLPVSQKILKEHGGRIVVTSEPGQGSCFTLELPALLPEAAPPHTLYGQKIEG